jgi:hypothetical protein
MSQVMLRFRNPTDRVVGEGLLGIMYRRRMYVLPVEWAYVGAGEE